MKTCEQIQETIFNSFEDNYRLPSDIENHLKTCDECTTVFNQLQELNQNLSGIGLNERVKGKDLEIEQQVINQIVIEGNNQRRRKELILDNSLFVICAMLFFTAVIVAIGFGFGNIVVIIELFLVMLSPIIIPVAIWRQVKGVSS